MAVKKLVVGFLPKDSRSALVGEQLNGPGHLFRRPYLHIIVWSGSRNHYSEETKVFQACACGEQIRIKEGDRTRGLFCWFVCHRQ